MPSSVKKCSSCGHEKPRTAFHKARSRKGGLQPFCKECVREYNSLPITRKRMKSYQNTKRAKDYRKRYDQTPRAKYALYKRVAIRRHHPFRLTLQEFMSFWKQPCYYCGDSIATIGLDQIIPGKGYAPDNVRAVCWACNRMKFNRTEEEYLSHLTRLVNYRVTNNMV